MNIRFEFYKWGSFWGFFNLASPKSCDASENETALLLFSCFIFSIALVDKMQKIQKQFFWRTKYKVFQAPRSMKEKKCFGVTFWFSGKSRWLKKLFWLNVPTHHQSKQISQFHSGWIVCGSIELSYQLQQKNYLLVSSNANSVIAVMYPIVK